MVVLRSRRSTAIINAAFIESTTGAIIDAEGMLNAVYRNLFNRDIELEGKQFWSPLLTSGVVTLDNVVTEVLFGARNSDYIAIQCKLEASLAYTEAASRDYEGYAGVRAAEIAHLWLQGIHDSMTLQTAVQEDALKDAINKLFNNQAPSDLVLSDKTVSENIPGAVVGTLSVTDANDKGGHSYKVNDDRFEIVDHELRLKEGVALDFEVAGIVSLVVTVFDEGGLSYAEKFRIGVIDTPESYWYGTPVDYQITIDAFELIDTVVSVFFDEEGGLIFDLSDANDIAIKYQDGHGIVTVFKEDGTSLDIVLQGIEDSFTCYDIDAIEFGYSAGTASVRLTDTSGDNTAFNLVGITDSIEMLIDLVLNGAIDQGDHSSLFDDVHYYDADALVTVNAPELLEKLYDTFVYDGQIVFDLWESNDIEIKYAEGEGLVTIFYENGTSQEFVLRNFEDVIFSSGTDDIEFNYADGIATAMINQKDGDLLEVAIVGIDTAIIHALDLIL